MIRYPESNIKVIFHNISYNFLLIFQVKQSHPVGFSEHINLDYIYLLETSAYKVYVSSCMGGWPQGPWTSLLWVDFCPWELQTREAALPSGSSEAEGAGGATEEILHRLLRLSQWQKVPWEQSHWHLLLVALTKVGGGRKTGEDLETSLRGCAGALSYLCSLRVGVSLRFLPSATRC